MIGKGPKALGAVWVAVKIPDGCVSGHSNQVNHSQIQRKKKKKEKR